MQRDLLLALILVGCVVLAGCSTLINTPADTRTTSTKISNESTTIPNRSATQTSDGQSKVTTYGVALSPNATAVYYRVEDLVASEKPTPQVTGKRVKKQSAPVNTAYSKFSKLMGMGNKTWSLNTTGRAGQGQIQIGITNDTTDAETEQVLAHEYAHYLAPRDVRERMKKTAGEYQRTSDATLTRDAVIEGTAVYIVDRYSARYLPESPSQSSIFIDQWDNWSSGTRYYFAPYYFGANYVHSQIDDPRHVYTVFDSPPITSEQLLHGLSPDEEPRRHLTVNTETENSSWVPTIEDSKGEMYIRIALSGYISDRKAARAAAGWGADRQITYYSGSSTGFVWVLKWDDAENASEFTNIMTSYLNTRATQNGTVWRDDGNVFRLNQVSKRTVVLTAGAPEFVQRTNASADQSEVKIKIRSSK